MSEIKLYNDDCLNVLKDIADNSIDCIVTDLPYGTTGCPWDICIPLEKLWYQFTRITKFTAPIVLFSQQPFTSALISSNYKMYKYNWIWIKENATNFLNKRYQPGKITEDICIFSKAPSSHSSSNPNMVYNPQMEQGTPYKCVNGNAKNRKVNAVIRSTFKPVVTESNGERLPNNVLYFNRDRDKVHPTQKPIELLKYLINTYSNENDTILDATMGSGSTGVACKLLKRNFIGIEMNKEYFNIAEKRIEDAKLSKLELI